jgi:hypothetical protein
MMIEFAVKTEEEAHYELSEDSSVSPLQLRIRNGMLQGNTGKSAEASRAN